MPLRFFVLRQRQPGRKVEVADPVLNAGGEHQKILGKQTCKRFVALGSKTHRFQHGIHARLTFVQRKRLLLRTQLAGFGIKEVEQHRDRAQRILAAAQQRICRRHELRFPVWEFAPVRRDGHGIDAVKLRERQCNAVIGKGKVNAGQARIVRR